MLEAGYYQMAIAPVKYVDRPFFPLPKKRAIALSHPSQPKHFWQHPNNLRFVKFSGD
jgi:hypothetical protein